MTAARYDITIDQGSDFSLELVVKESGTIKDLRNDTTSEPGVTKKWAVRSRYRKTLEESTAYRILAANTDKDSSANATGKIVLTHAYNSNSGVPAGTYLYDVELVQYDGTNSATDPDLDDPSTFTTYQVLRLLQGALTLRREVTR